MSTERESNSVFKPGQPQSSLAATAAAAGIQRVSIEESIAKDFGSKIPHELVPLPSRGLVYPSGHPLHLKEEVEISAMTSHEEDILMSRALIKKGTVVTELIRSCLVDKAINPVEMIIGDRNALMVAVRVTGYGSEYPVEVTCGACEEKYEHTFDLASLPVRSLELSPVSPGTNEFEFVLPKSKATVVFKFATGRDEEESLIIAERQKKLNLGNVDSPVTTGLRTAIVSVNGISDKAKLSQFASRMLAYDSSALRSFIRAHEPTVEMKQHAECQYCGHTEEVAVPIGVNFFWPNR